MATVTCTTMEEFVTVVAGLTREGLAFKADAGSLTVKITGY